MPQGRCPCCSLCLGSLRKVVSRSHCLHTVASAQRQLHNKASPDLSLKNEAPRTTHLLSSVLLFHSVVYCNTTPPNTHTFLALIYLLSASPSCELCEHGELHTEHLVQRPTPTRPSINTSGNPVELFLDRKNRGLRLPFAWSHTLLSINNILMHTQSFYFIIRYTFAFNFRGLT